MTKKLTALFLMAVLTVALASAMGCTKKAEDTSTTSSSTTTETSSAAPTDTAMADTSMHH